MDLRRLTFALAPVVAAAGIGGLASRDAADTYERLRKPGWAPPASAFGPVWSGLYAGTTVAGWLMYPGASRRTKALHLTQLALNGAWPAAFFGARDKRRSLAVIAALDTVLATEVLALRRESPAAAALLTPYLAWTGFATALNAAVSEPATS
jgi:translocator protein